MGKLYLLLKFHILLIFPFDLKIEKKLFLVKYLWGTARWGRKDRKTYELKPRFRLTYLSFFYFIFFL